MGMQVRHVARYTPSLVGVILAAAAATAGARRAAAQMPGESLSEHRANDPNIIKEMRAHYTRGFCGVPYEMRVGTRTRKRAHQFKSAAT